MKFNIIYLLFGNSIYIISSDKWRSIIISCCKTCFSFILLLNLVNYFSIKFVILDFARVTLYNFRQYIINRHIFLYKDSRIKLKKKEKMIFYEQKIIHNVSNTYYK